MSGGGGDGSEPDLTPMLDMVFQLITFFMLVTNMKAAALDLNLKLPVVGSARPVDTGGAEELLILNVMGDGKINHYGIVRDPGPYIASEAQVSRMKAKQQGEELKPGDELETHPVDLEVSYDEALGHREEAYQRLLEDAMTGDARRFGREDALDEQWRIVQKVLDEHDDVHLYAEGSWGPKQADQLAESIGGWIDPLPPGRS